MILLVPVRSCSDFPVAQMVNLPAVQETWVRSLGWEDPPEEGMVTHSSILAWSIPMDGGAWWATVRGVTKVLDTSERQHSQVLFTHQYWLQL